MKDWFLGSTPNTIQCKLLLFLILTPPIIAATVNHGISYNFFIIFLIALFSCKGGWSILEQSEKRLLLGFSLFFLFSALSLLYSTDPKEGASFLERYLRPTLLIPIYLMLRIQGIESSRVFVLGAFIGVFVMVIQAWYQIEILQSEVAHGAYHKIILGDMAILFSVLIFITMLFFAKSIWHYGLAIFGVAAGVYTSVLSFTRSAWLFLPIFIILMIWLYRDKLTKRDFLKIVVSLCIVASALIYYTPKILKDGFEQGIADITRYENNPEIESSWGSRLNLWHHSILIFKTKPILGAGAGGYHAAAQDLLADGTISASMKNSFAIRQTNAHSIYFQLLAEGGIIGLLLMVTTILILPYIYLYRLWKTTTDRDLRYITLAGLTSIVAFAWFGTSTGWLIRNSPISLYCFIILVFLSSAANRKNYLDAISNTKIKGVQY